MLPSAVMRTFSPVRKTIFVSNHCSDAGISNANEPDPAPVVFATGVAVLGFVRSSVAGGFSCAAARAARQAMAPASSTPNANEYFEAVLQDCMILTLPKYSQMSLGFASLAMHCCLLGGSSSANPCFSQTRRLRNGEYHLAELLAMFEIAVCCDAIVERPNPVDDWLQAPLRNQIQHGSQFTFVAHVRPQDGKLPRKQKT